MRVLRLDISPDNKNDEEGRCEDLHDDKPTVPLFGLCGRMRVSGERVLGHLLGGVHNVVLGGDEKLRWRGDASVVGQVGGTVRVRRLLQLRRIGAGATLRGGAIEAELRIEGATDRCQGRWKTEVWMPLTRLLIIIITSRLDDGQGDG